MNRRRAVLLSPVVLLVCLLAAEGLASGPAEFDRATRLAMDGDYEGALGEYEAFLARAPDDRLSPVAAAAIANIHLRVRHDTTSAIRSLDRLLDEHGASPWAPDAARQKGECAAAQERWIAAGESYQLAVALATEQERGPSDDWINEVTLAAADCYHHAGDPQRVIETYLNVLEQSPPPEVAATALYRLGESYESSDDGRRAAESYAQVVGSYPATAMFERAIAKRELIDEHMSLDWKAAECYAEATALIAEGDVPGAIAKCDEILAGPAEGPLRDSAEYRKIVFETVHSGDFTEGCERLRRYIDDHPGGQRTARAQRTLDQQWSRIAELELRAGENPDDVATMSALGQSYIQARSFGKGVETLEKALALQPDDADAHFAAGRAYLEAGRGAEATRAFSVYLNSNPDDVIGLNLIGYAILGQGQAEEAIPYFERYAEIAPEEANAHDSLGEGYMAAGRLEESAREYEKAVEIDPSFANSHFMLGRVYQQMEKQEKAVAAYERFLELNTQGPQADQARAALAELRAPEES